MLDGDALAEALALADVGEADAVVLLAVALADSLVGAELVVVSSVGDLLGEAEAVAVCVGLAEALVASTDDAAADAETVTVSAAALPEALPSAVATATALLAGAPAPPLPTLPYTRNATTATPAKPPVSISPIPRRFSDRRDARDRRASSAARPRLPPSASSAATDIPRRPPPADLAPLPLPASLAASASETTEGRGLSARRPPTGPCGPVTRSPSYGSESGTGSRACDLACPEPLTGGIRTVERPSCTLESSRPVAPQPGQETAPLRCLRQVLQ